MSYVLAQDGNSQNISEAIANLEKEKQEKTVSLFNNLTSWQITQLSRHPKRPYTLDYVSHLFTEFEELHGDRHYADDEAIVGGVARFDDKPIVVIGLKRGVMLRKRCVAILVWPRPEGYRKACRLNGAGRTF